MVPVDTKLIDYQAYRSILCLDGTLPSADFFQCGLPVFAADGAANKLMKMDIKPQLVIGDLDAIDPSLLNQVETFYHEDQNYCDFEKALMYLSAHDFLPCIITGVNGGCLDHILNNVNIFMRSANVFYAPPLYGFTLNTNEHRSFDLPFNTKLSLMGIPAARVSTKGLKWNLSDALLSFPGPGSCFNRSVDKTIEFTIHEGSALLLIYQ